MRLTALFTSSFLGLATLVAALAQDAPKLPSLPPPAPAVAVTPAKLDGLEPLGCTKCHAEIVDEWAATAHAVAWVDEAYQEEIKGRKKPESCHGCHIPQPLHSGDPTARP